MVFAITSAAEEALVVWTSSQLKHTTSSLIVIIIITDCPNTRLSAISNRAFLVADARVSNGLPWHITSAWVFCSCLKTHLFSHSFQTVCSACEVTYVILSDTFIFFVHAYLFATSSVSSVIRCIGWVMSLCAHILCYLLDWHVTCYMISNCC